MREEVRDRRNFVDRDACNVICAYLEAQGSVRYANLRRE